MSITEKINALDKFGMFDKLKSFPKQITDSIEIVKNAPKLKNKSPKFHLLGMGGSAIAGDLLQAFFRNSNFNEIEISVNRNYYLLKSLDTRTNVIVSSYSGNTEETIEAYYLAKKYTDNIIGITTGGKIKEILTSDGYPVITIPTGFQPREALGFSFFTLLLFIINSLYSSNISNEFENKLHNLSSFLNNKGIEYTNPEKNSALDFAKTLKGKVILTYACEETLFPVALRFKAQVQENAKNLSFAGAIPEMNHNEINSFLNPPEILNKIKVILLKDMNDHPKNSKRIDAMYMILKEKIETNILESEEADFLFRMFDLIYFLDWASFYLAIENNIEPTPIPIISELKNYIQR